MQSLHSKVIITTNNIIGETGISATHYHTIYDLVQTTLLEQDRDTRHACAEAIITNNILTEDNEDYKALVKVVNFLKNYFHDVVINCNEGTK